MIESGAIGRVLSASILSTTMAFGYEIERAMAFAEQPENGVTLLSIQGAHTIDLAIAVLGEFAEVSALASTQYPEIAVGSVTQARTIFDHVNLIARLACGAPLSVEVVGGSPADDTPFRLEITGTEGVLVLQGGAPRGVQSGELHLLVDGKLQDVGSGQVSEPGTAVNVASMYAALRDDILNGTWTTPDFDHAVRMNRLVDDVVAAATTGERKLASGWARL